MSERELPVVPKFRAWDSIKKEMFKDTFAITESGEVVVVEQEFVTSTPDYVFVDHLVIMQSTGLLDKNGKEIFEGDIIRYNIDVVDIKRHPTLGFYTVLDGREGFFGDGMSIDDFEEDAKEFSKTAEIIGNIYENPELLGQ